MILASLIGTFLFFTYEVVRFIVRSSKTKAILSNQSKLKDDEFRGLQVELYKEVVLLNDTSCNTNHSNTSSNHIGTAACKQIEKIPDCEPGDDFV